MSKVLVYEKSFLISGAILLVLCLGALVYSTVAMGIHLPGRGGVIDPARLDTTPPFDRPGVHQTGPNAYEVVVRAYAFGYDPAEIRVPAGAEITFIGSSRDVIHGFNIEGTRINMMLIPGQVSRNVYTFREPGEHLLICHEYCGVGHHFMHGKIIAE